MKGRQRLQPLTPESPPTDEAGCGGVIWNTGIIHTMPRAVKTSLDVPHKGTTRYDKMTTMTTAAIVAAIENRQCLRISYYPGERLIEPHAFGRGSDGQLLLRAYQVSGASASGEHEHWKLFRVDRLDLVGLDPCPSLVPRPGYKPGDKAMKGGIIAEV